MEPGAPTVTMTIPWGTETFRLKALCQASIGGSTLFTLLAQKDSFSSIDVKVSGLKGLDATTVVPYSSWTSMPLFNEALLAQIGFQAPFPGPTSGHRYQMDGTLTFHNWMAGTPVTTVAFTMTIQEVLGPTCSFVGTAVGGS